MGTEPLPSSPFLWIEQGEQREGPVARVAMLAAVEKTYTFAIPDELTAQVQPGKRLMVPFGKKQRLASAFCLGVDRQVWTSTLKPVASVLDEQPLLSEPMIELGTWMARYYCCPIGRTLAAMVPEAIRRQSGFRTVRTVRLAGETAADSQTVRSARQRAVLELLAAAPGGIELGELLAKAGVGSSVVAALTRAGRVSILTHRRPAPAPNFDVEADEPSFELNTAQRTAVGRIGTLTRAGQFRAVLLFGVSGSGKTEVYVHAIRSVLEAGRQAILLIPEIALTTQLVHRLAGRFKNVAVIHSGLTGAQRSLIWNAIALGEKPVVIGTRSAVFAPCPNLGLIVVDEEQEGSYKNLQSPRFHTRDVAIKRAQMASIPIVLGSATPSLETWHNCERLPHFERIDLPHRIAGLLMPAVDFVDMREPSRPRKGLHLLSVEMERGLSEALDAGRQAILLLNRRGYANYLVCARCRTPIVCPNCRVNMVFHQTTGKALCHYCQASMPVPRQCGDSSCGGKLIRFGMGTQRVEEELRAKFPDARLARADSDTMTHVSEYERVVREFAEQKVDVLIGTQMIAKGLDFPNVAFVGVVNADTAMSIPDFRSAERTFQLLTQVAGRAGRAECTGRVVVQSYSGRTPAIDFAAGHDYVGFARCELGIRRRLNWPPFSRLARVVVSDRSDTQAATQARELVSAIRKYLFKHGLPGDVLGPQSAPLSRLRNQYRYDFLIRAENASRLMQAMERLLGDKVLSRQSRQIMIDVDPASLL